MHSSVASHALSRQFGLTLDEARTELLAAVNALGRDQFRLVYCRHDPESSAFSLHSSDATMDIESDDMVLFAVQYKQVSREAINQADRSERAANMECARSEGKLMMHETAGIRPMEGKVRDLLPHRKQKAPGSESAGQAVSGNGAGKTGGGAKVQNAVPRGKPSVIKSQTKINTTVQPKIEDRAIPESASIHPPPSPKSTSPQKPPPPPEASSPATPTDPPPDSLKPSHPHVAFTEDPSHVNRVVKRRSTPHPNKHTKRSESINDILKSSLYTVEEDDTEATPQATLKRKLETTEKPEKKTAVMVSTPAETEASQVPTEGFKRVKVAKTKTFQDEKGYMVSKDVIEEEVVKVQTLPQKPVLSAAVAHKKGKQTDIGSFFGRK